jgi:hypothetical protein
VPDIILTCSRAPASGPASDHARTEAQTPRQRLPSGVDGNYPVVGHAAARWAGLVMVVVRSDTDVPTLGQWGRMSRHGETTLKTRCEAAGGATPGDSLNFARALRVVARHTGHVCDWYNDLEILDPRTLARFLDRAGLPKKAPLPDVATFLLTQRFITSHALLSAIRTCLGLSA